MADDGLLAGRDWRRLLSLAFVLVALGVWAGLAQGWRNQIFLVSTWFGGWGFLPEPFHAVPHRLHEFAFALMLWPLVVGLLAQLRSPRRHLAGMLMAVGAMVAVLLAIAATGFTDPIMVVVFLGTPTLLAALVHPAGRELIASIEVQQVNRVLLVLVVIAAIPLLAFAVNQVGLQTGAIQPAHDQAGAGHGEEVHEEHLEVGHFMLTTAFVFALLLTGLIATFQQPGWWLAAWVAGLMAVVYALAALLVPQAASNTGLVWGLAMIAWGVVFIAAAEYTQDGAAPSLLRRRTGSPAS
jgi:hypothetical protein